MEHQGMLLRCSTVSQSRECQTQCSVPHAGSLKVLVLACEALTARLSLPLPGSVDAGMHQQPRRAQGDTYADAGGWRAGAHGGAGPAGNRRLAGGQPGCLELNHRRAETLCAAFALPMLPGQAHSVRRLSTCHGTFRHLQGSAQRTCVVQFVIMPHDEAAEQAFLDDEPV